MAGANTVPSPNIKHFSHPHILELSSFQCQQGQTNPSVLCSCCKLTPSGQVYICRPCNFILHLNCSQFPELITHGAHGNHTLTLLPTSPYGSGKFGCDACGNQGNEFTYHCRSCRYDLHPICAFKPLKFTHQFHACPLALTFKDPCTTDKCFSCDICGKSIGSNKWRYRCSKCNFDVHLGCTKASPARGMVQGGQSPAPQNQNRFLPGSSTSNIPNQPVDYMNVMAGGIVQGGGQVAGRMLAHHVLGDTDSNTRDDQHDDYQKTVDQGDSKWEGDRTGEFIGDNPHEGTIDQGDGKLDIGEHIGGFIRDFLGF